MTTTFWFNDPTVLINKNNMFKIWPNSSMKREEKLNTITKLVLLLTLVGYTITLSNNILLSGVFTIIGIVVFYKTTSTDLVEPLVAEPFTGMETFEELKDNYDLPKTTNPLQNMEPVTDNSPATDAKDTNKDEAITTNSLDIFVILFPLFKF